MLRMFHMKGFRLVLVRKSITFSELKVLRVKPQCHTVAHPGSHK